jgi:chorismate dehydratase
VLGGAHRAHPDRWTDACDYHRPCYPYQLSPARPRVCAVSYLNTAPLVWGMLHGPQRGLFDLEFQIPSVCADRMASGAADIGIVPSFELTRQNLEILPGAGIACHGAVRSILLVSACPAARIARLAADSSSRTSVQLARIILQRRYGARPELVSHPPDLDAMLRTSDAALLIGDPALRADPARLPYEVHDLGAEWVEMTGLPMVFAVWAGRPGVAGPEVAQAFRDSCRFGRDHLEELVAAEAASRGFPPALVRDYLTRHIVNQLGEREYQGMYLFLSWARELAASPARASTPAWHPGTGLSPIG